MADISKIVLPDTSEYNVKDAGAARHNEAICLARAHNGDGILDGCEMEITGTDLEISSGSVLAGGKVAYFPTGEEVALGGISITDGYVQVILNIQLSHNPQVWITLEESPTTTFDPLTQNDLNIAGNLYQYELCKVEVVSGVLSIYSTSQPSNLVSGDIYINNDTDPTLHLCDASGVQKGYIGTTGNVLRVINSTGTCGLRTYGEGYVILYGNSNEIRLRPNGYSSTTGQVIIGADGQQIGGHKITESNNGSASISVSTSVKQVTSLALNSSGVFLVVGQATFTPSSTSVQGYVSIGLGSASTAQTFLTTCWTHANNTNGKHFNVVGLVDGWATAYLNVVSTNPTGNVTSYRLRATRLA